jgi:GTP cyclohydrolase I
LLDKYSGEDLIKNGVGFILNGLALQFNIDTTGENFVETPERVTKAYLEILSGSKNTKEKIDEILKKSFPSEYRGMIIASSIRANSMCPHHLLPVEYKVNFGYIPGERVLGVSKLARLVKLLAKRLILQEDYTKDLADVLEPIHPLGTIVQVSGRHMCMVCRGVEEESSIITSEIRGFFNKQDVRDEFMMLIKNNINNKE